MVLFAHNVKQIKGVAHKNSDIDGMCKRGLNARPSVPTQLAFFAPESLTATLKSSVTMNNFICISVLLG